MIFNSSIRHIPKETAPHNKWECMKRNYICDVYFSFEIFTSYFKLLQMKPAIIILFFSIFFGLTAQTEIKGPVLYKQTQKPVANAAVTLHPVGSISILTYAMTDDEGKFTLQRNELPDSVTITVSAMTIEKQSNTVKSNIGFIEILVKEESIELNEVIVKAPKIRQRGDTVH